MTTLPRLARRMSMAIAAGRGITLSAAELDLLVEVGCYDVLQAASAEVLKAEAKRRNEAREKDQS